MKTDAFRHAMPRPYRDRYNDPERGPGYVRTVIRNPREAGRPEDEEATFSGTVIRLAGLAVKG